MKKLLAILLSAVMIGSLAACGSQSDTKSSSKSDSETTAPAETKAAEPKTNLPKLDNSKWKYNEDGEFYYQVGIDYCEKPVDETLQKVAFIVPAAYMDATDNKNGTFTCKLSENGTINGYTASNAPIVMSIVVLAVALFAPYSYDEELKDLKRQRDMRRARREKQEQTVVALVGYTNALL